MIKILLLSLLIIILIICPFAAVFACQTGEISWYGPNFHGKPTANGEIFDQNKLTCASNSLPLGTKVVVTNLKNNKQIILKVNDTGGFKKYNRVLDVSKAAAQQLGMIHSGTTKAKICEVTPYVN